MSNELEKRMRAEIANAPKISTVWIAGFFGLLILIAITTYLLWPRSSHVSSSDHIDVTISPAPEFYDDDEQRVTKTRFD